MVKKVSIHSDGWTEMEIGTRFGHQRLALTDGSNDAGLGAAVYRVPPGRRAFPKHAHLANDESLYVLTGRGLLEVGEQQLELTEGDYVLLPRGSEYPHILINNGDADLTYLCMSTMNMPDVVHYPDSDKLGVLERKFWSSAEDAGNVGGFYQRQPVDYWHGEDTDEE